MVVAGQRRHIRDVFVGPKPTRALVGESMATSSVIRVTSSSKERFGSISSPVWQKSEV